MIACIRYVTSQIMVISLSGDKSKNVGGTANTTDPDQTAPLTWVITVRYAVP